eukprot:5597820-Alexandrium_andersonii.AAC.1
MEAFILTHDWVVGVPLPWVALACLFEAISGHRIGGEVQATLLSKEQSAREVVACFRKAFCSCFANCIHQEEGQVMKPVTTGAHALTALGFFGRLACVNIWPCVEVHEWDTVTCHMIEMRPSQPKGWREQLARGELTLLPQQANLARAPVWRSRESAGRRPASLQRTCLIECKSCKSTIALNSMPTPEGTSYPKVKCTSCGKVARCGTFRCLGCDRAVA